jgi:hypothetical protein
MRILSFDVGVVNIGCCSLERTPERNIMILYWDLINLKSESRIQYKCSGKMKNGKSCGKKGTYHQKSPDGIRAYCKLHLAQGETLWPMARVEKYFKPSTSHICQKQNTKGDPCGKGAKHYCRYTKNHYCQTHYRSVAKSLWTQFKPRKTTSKSVKKTRTDELQLELVRRLDNLSKCLEGYGLDEVIIENQPMKKNGKMGTIANTIFVYYLMRGVYDKSHGLDLKRVRFISPSNKLKVDSDNTLKVFNSSVKGEKYKLTKALGIQYTKTLLKDDPWYIDYLNLFPKKDDLCDAYLQGVYYLLIMKDTQPKKIL